MAKNVGDHISRYFPQAAVLLVGFLFFCCFRAKESTSLCFLRIIGGTSFSSVVSVSSYETVSFLAKSRYI